MQTDRVLLRASFVLFLLSLLTGMLIPVFRVPRLGLSAHLTGLMNSFVLVSLAVIWPRLSEARGAGVIKALFLGASFTMTFGSILSAAWGTHWLTPMASVGFTAPLWKEVVIAALILGTVLTYILAAGIVVWELRPRA